MKSVFHMQQAESFLAYQARGGPLKLREWMEAKDFQDEDREMIRFLAEGRPCKSAVVHKGERTHGK